MGPLGPAQAAANASAVPTIFILSYINFRKLFSGILDKITGLQ